MGMVTGGRVAGTGYWELTPSSGGVRVVPVRFQ